MAKSPPIGKVTPFYCNESDACKFHVDFLNSIDHSQLPPHKLRLKVNVIVMLIRNLDPPKLCNGTKINNKKIKKMSLKPKLIQENLKEKRCLYLEFHW